MQMTYVITTIQPPTAGVRMIAKRASAQGARFIVVGDRKSPNDWNLPGVDYFSLDNQSEMGFLLARALPENSYTRKMIGYLIAAMSSTAWIRETDDDNLPYSSFFITPDQQIRAAIPDRTSEWVNIYSHFTDRFIWPRGFPLSLVADPNTKPKTENVRTVNYPYVLQALADGDPDVDAIYRLTAPDTSEIRFRSENPLGLPSGVWSPFNSQATTWPRDLLPLMYLPSSCTFRMTDIWRSFVVQRLMAGLGASLVVTAATVHQDRNEHDLLEDFSQEVPGYLRTERLRDVLESTSTRGGREYLGEDLFVLYEALVTNDFLKAADLTLLDAWLSDVSTVELSTNA